MQGQGWVKFWRKSLETRIFKDSGLWQLWTWCLLSASYEPEWGKVTVARQTVTVKLEPGQFVFSRRQAAKALGTSPSAALRKLLKLASLDMLKVNNRLEADRNITIVTIVNWDTYQGDSSRSGPQPDHKSGGEADRKSSPNRPYITAACISRDSSTGPQNEDASGPKEIYKEEDSSEQPSAAFACPFFSVSTDQHARHLAAYPGLDLLAEYRRMESWLEANPKKRKTPRGYPRFVNSWLSRVHKDRQARPAAEDWRAKYVEAPD